jgi:hypothetical protein
MHMKTIICNFNQVQAITPWWWILCDPKHVGVIFNVCLLDFYTTQILTSKSVSIECISWLIKGTVTVIYSESLVSNPQLHSLLIQRNAVGQNPILFKTQELLLRFRIFFFKVTHFSSHQQLIYSLNTSPSFNLVTYAVFGKRTTF